MGGQYEEHHDEPQGEHETALPARGALLVGLPAEGVAHASAGVFVLGQPLHRGEHVPGAFPGPRRPDQQRRREPVEARDDARARPEFGPGEGRDRHHLLIGPAHIEPPDVVGRLAEAGLRLGLHPVRLAIAVEIVDVERRQRRLQRLEQLRQRDAERLHLLAVHLHEQLRGVDADRRIHTAQLGQRVGVGGELSRQAGEPRHVVHPPVLEIQLETRGRTEADDLGEVEREAARLLQLEEIPVDGAEHRGELLPRSGPLVPRLQHDEHDRRVRLVRILDKVEADERDDVVDRRLLQEKPFDLLHDGFGALPRGIVGELDEHAEVPLVLARNEAARDGPHEDQQQDHRHPEGGEERAGPVDHATSGAKVALGHRAEPAIEATEEPVEGSRHDAARRRARRSLRYRTQQDGAQRRGQGERDDARQDHRNRDGDGELLVHESRDASQERDRDEHGAQHQDDGDQRPTHLAHRLVSGDGGRDPLLGHDALDVFDHDDCVVHDDADREHQTEQREQVDREAEHLHPEECPDHGDGHRDHRDEGRPPALQEDEDHQGHEQQRLEQRLHDLLDRLGDVRRRVERDRPADARWEALGELAHSGDDLTFHLEGVRAGTQEYRGQSRGRAVEPAGQVVVPCAEMRVPDVGEVYE